MHTRVHIYVHAHTAYRKHHDSLFQPLTYSQGPLHGLLAGVQAGTAELPDRCPSKSHFTKGPGPSAHALPRDNPSNQVMTPMSSRLGLSNLLKNSELQGFPVGAFLRTL